LLLLSGGAVAVAVPKRQALFVLIAVTMLAQIALMGRSLAAR
jgi:hypothetical protein